MKLVPLLLASGTAQFFVAPGAPMPPGTAPVLPYPAEAYYFDGGFVKVPAPPARVASASVACWAVFLYVFSDSKSKRIFSN